MKIKTTVYITKGTVITNSENFKGDNVKIVFTENNLDESKKIKTSVLSEKKACTKSNKETITKPTSKISFSESPLDKTFTVLEICRMIASEAVFQWLVLLLAIACTLFLVFYGKMKNSFLYRETFFIYYSYTKSSRAPPYGYINI